MTRKELTAATRARHPEYTVEDIYDRPNPGQGVEVGLEPNGKRMERLFNPYTGEDLGNRLRPGFRLLLWLVNLHDNLLSGRTGRFVNGIGGSLLAILALSGPVIWWARRQQLAQ